MISARLVVPALLLALCPTGCGDAPTAEPPRDPADNTTDAGEHGPLRAGRRAGPEIVRLLAAADAGSASAPESHAAAVDLLPPLADDHGSWWPVPTGDASLDAPALARRPAPDLALGPEGGGWLRVLPVARNSDVRLTLELQTRGLPDDGASGARVSLLELVREPDPAALHELPELLTAAHHGDWLGGDGVHTVTLATSVRGATRHLGILISQPPRPDDASARVRVDALALRRPGLLDQVRGLLADDTLFADLARPVVGSASIRHVARPSLLLLPGAGARLPAVVPEGRVRLVAHLGAVPHTDFDSGTRLDLRLELVDPTDERVLAGRTERLRTQGRKAARWQPFELELPAALAGRAVELRVTCDAPADARVLAAVAEPRLLPDAPARPGPNVVIVSLDTLRADRLGTYGYSARETSPRLDAWAAESAVFLDTWTQAPFTLPSHVSLFSGQFPSVHGVRMHLDRPHPTATTLLAEWLLEHGWSTAAFTAGGYVSPDFGFGRGFQRYGSLEPLANLESERVRSMIERYPGTTVEMFAEQQWDTVLDWIDEHADESFLLFAHSYTVHQFDPRLESLAALGLDADTRAADDELQTWLTRFETPPDDVLARLDALYDATVRQADAAVGRLLDRLDALGLTDETIVIVTSDHGKELGERGLVAHGHSLHEELLRVPLIIKVPGDPPRRVEEPAMLVDVLPTLCDALGLDTPPGLQGVSLREPLDPRRVLYAEVDDLAVLRALKQGPLKTIHAPLDADAVHANTVEERSYDLHSDPGERTPLAGDPARLERLREFRAGLEALREALGGGDGGGELSPEMAEHLRQLGYLVGDA